MAAGLKAQRDFFPTLFMQKDVDLSMNLLDVYPCVPVAYFWIGHVTLSSWRKTEWKRIGSAPFFQ